MKDRKDTIMKKIYSNPTCKWMVMTSEKILVTSIIGIYAEDPDEIGWGGVGNGGGDANSFSVWGEEEENN